MKLPLCILLPACLWSFPVHAAESITENFESIASGSSAAAAGWQFFAGNGTLDQLTITEPASPDNHSTRCLTGAADGPDIQIYKAFPDSFDARDVSRDIDYSVKIFPRASGQKVPRLLFGIRTNEEKLAYLFGVEGNDYSTAKFAFRVGSKVSQDYFPVGHLYEVRLTIGLGAGLKEAAGSLSVRDLTAGQSDWTPVGDLQNVPLGLTEAFLPEKWSDWLIRGEYRREIDDLTLSVHTGRN